MCSRWDRYSNWYLHSSHRGTLWGISPSIYNFGIDYDVDKKLNFALLDLDGDTNVEPVYSELDRSVQVESVTVELDLSLIHI